VGAAIRPPNIFRPQDDLFSVLGKDRRPDHRWLIAGPARSGSSFHVDPNCTSAWNATISGRKKWIMFPPGETPPGVHPSEDGLDLAAPVSITEWFLNFYEPSILERSLLDRALHTDIVQRVGRDKYQYKSSALELGRMKYAWIVVRWAWVTVKISLRPLECVVSAGEVVFVPMGWWHCVLNLEWSVAITQNFVSRVNLPNVVR
ncbi:unnamed protein product, partial [Hapterophycus canaliculatus]